MGSLRTARSLTSRNMSSAPPARTLMLSSLLSRSPAMSRNLPDSDLARFLVVTGSRPAATRPISASLPYCRVSPPPPAAPAPARNSAALRRLEHIGPPVLPQPAYHRFPPTSIRTARPRPLLLLLRNPASQLRSERRLAAWLARYWWARSH